MPQALNLWHPLTQWKIIMKSISHTLLFSLLINFFLVSGIAAQQGSIRGQVLESDGLPAIGANILLNGQAGVGTVTDLDGYFVLDKLSAGTYSITVSYLSHQTQTIKDIKVNNQATDLGTIHLQPASVEITTVVVTAKALQNTETAIQTLQRKSLNPIDGISSQTFSATGDGHAGAAIKRISGVSVQNGKYVFVRGLGGRYSLTTLNGLTIPGLDPDRNTVQMDIFPTNILDNIIVYKAFTPDLPASFTGGLVDIRTKDFPSELNMAFSLGMQYNPQVHLNGRFLTHTGSSTDWLGYDNGFRQIPQAVIQADESQLQSTYAAVHPDEAGLLVRSFSKAVEPYTISRSPDYSLSFSLGNQVKWLGRPLGFIAALSYKRNSSFDGTKKQGRFLYISHEADSLIQDENFDVQHSRENTLLSAIFSSSYKLNNDNKLKLTFLHNQAGSKETRLQQGPVYSEDLGYQERFLAFQQRNFSSLQLHGYHSFGAKENFQLNWSSSYSLAEMSQPDLRFLNNAYIRQGEEIIYSIQPAIGLIPTRYWRQMHENLSANKIDFTYGFSNWTERKGRLKAGVAFNYRSRSFNERIFQFESLSNEFDGSFEHYFSDENAISSENAMGVFLTENSNPKNIYQASQSISAAYLMTELPLSKRLRAIGGLRMEKAQIHFNNLSIQNGLLLDDLDLLPALGLIYALQEDKMNLRLNYNHTIARPVFREIADVAFFEFLNNNFLLGNPDLQRTRIANLDLRWEYFFAPGEKILISAFHKDFTNPIELTNNPEAKNGEWVYKNVEQARVLGIEVEWRKRLNFIPALRNFIFGSNISLIQSRASIAAEELANIRFHQPDASDTRPLFGQSPYLINAFLAYQNEQGTNLQINYNVQGPRLYLVQVGAMPDVYEQPFHQIDLTARQQLGAFTLSFGISNLLNQARILDIAFKDKAYIFSSTHPGRTFSLGLTYEIR